jgi:hypothetical protein
MSSSNEAAPRTDPLVISARREALIVVVVWFLAMIYSVSTCYWLGYNRSISELKLVFGMPEWVFWGILVPWSVCTVFSWIFGRLFIQDGHLGEDLEGSDDELGLGG